MKTEPNPVTQPVTSFERLRELESKARDIPECERLRKALEELREVTQELVKLAEVWTPEFTRTIHNARCVLINAMQPSETCPNYRKPSVCPRCECEIDHLGLCGCEGVKL